MNAILDEVTSAAGRAVASLQSRAGGRLDFSVASLAAVDEMLVEVSAYVADLDEAVVTGLVQQLGCYVLEVGRRAFGGEYFWHEEGEQPILVVGEPAAHVALMTWSKVVGRLTGDEGDDIVFFFNGFADKAADPEPGSNVLFL
ncbi:hypothetical protein [Scleromatobacter humisilvae]|uniref:Uncharacterized protein n=1 Tax=Scleromatobacter humisilvae TaxID=2897159 RepID=A0A9X1YNL4_9BURK|nr:hypothetical protein [Scleromatobacter humisilvae]MCK9688078.1 hypothetical protein [Scleromatobacter humisilvae]